MENKTASRSKLLIGLIIGAIVIFGVILTFILKPDWIPSFIKKFFEPPAVSKEPEPAGKYVVKGASDSATILVKFKDNVSTTRINSIHASAKTKIKKTIAKLKTQVVLVPTNVSTGTTLAKFKAMAEVEYAEPNFMADVLLTPNDPLYSSQWGLSKMSAPTAWDSAKGNFGSVAVVDTGILATHPDLSGEVTTGYNFVNSTANATDDNGHGTHVSGIIAALTNNGVGVASIGYKTTLIPVKVLNSSGSGTYADVASGIIYGADRGAKVINLSLGGASSSITLQNAVNYANNKGVYVVAAAGNSGSSAPLYPAACTGVLAVSATDSNDKLATFSSYGKNVFIGAPGVSINSTYLSNSYRYLSGTSMATPQFSGLLELALGYASSINYSVVKADMLNYIKSSSDKVGGFTYDTNGWNQYFGYGRLNATKLIAAIAAKAPAPTSTPTPTPTPTPPPTENPPTSDKFDVVINGTIDSLAANRVSLRLKLTNISQNLKLKPTNIVDLLLTKATQIKRNGKAIAASGLKIGDKLNVKASYKDNALTALTITAQGK